MTTEREKLLSHLSHQDNCQYRYDGPCECEARHDASRLLAAGFRLVTPTSEGEAKKAARLLLDLEPVNFTAHGAQEAAKICARYILAPSKDVVEEAENLVHDWIVEWAGLEQDGMSDLRKVIAVFATAHAARERADEREANCKAVCINCRQDVPLSPYLPDFHTSDPTSPTALTQICEAALIRARTP